MSPPFPASIPLLGRTHRAGLPWSEPQGGPPSQLRTCLGGAPLGGYGLPMNERSIDTAFSNRAR